MGKSLWCVSFLSGIYIMAILVRVMKIHIGNIINRPPRQNAPMFRVLTSFTLKRIQILNVNKNSRYGAPWSIGTSRSNSILKNRYTYIYSVLLWS